ncbi:MAG: hypothetical protein LBT05_04810 [Planctomycetaceae bacterium]|jgi:hypothetical protein|nr:hypothetical protein [Planctomycetaceae bacterium]
MLNLLPQNATPCRNAYIVNVTPELAKQWLDNNNFNRPKNQPEVDRYVHQIQSGLWRRTHQGAAFSSKGVLLDGQHRLWAIVQSGQSVPMLVFINEPLENYEYIDCGRNRSNLDTMRMSQRDNTITTLHTQTLKAMLVGRVCKNSNLWSNAALNELYRKHNGVVKFAAEQFIECKNKQINDPTVRGVIARAGYHIPHDRLMEFCGILKGASSNHPATSAIENFRTCLTIWQDRRENTKREIYKRCEHLLTAFSENREISGFPIESDELFPF